MSKAITKDLSIKTSDQTKSKSIEKINALSDYEINDRLSELMKKVNSGKFLNTEEDLFVGGIIKKHRETKISTKTLNRQAERAKTILTIANTRAVYSIANRMLKHMPIGATKEDCVSEGMIGMARAITTYDPDTGYRFLTYATLWIRHYIQRNSMEIARITKLPGANISKMVRIDNKIKELTSDGSKMSSRKMAELLEAENMTTAEYQKIKSFNKMSLSFDAPAFNDDGTATVADMLDVTGFDKTTMGDIIGPEDSMDRTVLSKSLERALNSLTLKERNAIMLVYGEGVMTENGEKKRSLASARDELGMRRREFERTLESAKRKLKEALVEDDSIPAWLYGEKD